MGKEKYHFIKTKKWLIPIFKVFYYWQYNKLRYKNKVWHFDYNDQACFFDEEKEKKDKYKMLTLLGKLKKRLYEINDGFFEIGDKYGDTIDVVKTPLKKLELIESF